MAKIKCKPCKGYGWLKNEHGQWESACGKCDGVGLVEESVYIRLLWLLLRGVSWVLTPVAIWFIFQTNTLLREQNKLLYEELTAREKGYHITDQVHILAVEDLDVNINHETDTIR